MRQILVIGASGDQGSAQVEQLRAAGYKVRAMSRRAGGAAQTDGLETVRADLLEPSSLPRALEGVDTVFLNLPSASFTDPDVVLAAFGHFIAAAEAVSLSRIVFNASLYVGDRPMGHIAHDVRYRIVERLFSSSVPAVVVCPVIFMENMLRGWALPALQERRVLSYPHAEDLRVSWISLSDVARIMIALAGDPDAAGRKFIVGGPEALRGPETAAALSEAWSCEIQFESLPVESFAKRMGDLFGGSNRQVRRRIEHDMLNVYRWYNDARPSPFTVDMSGFLSNYPLSLTTVRRWAERNRIFDISAALSAPAGERVETHRT